MQRNRGDHQPLPKDRHSDDGRSVEPFDIVTTRNEIATLLADAGSAIDLDQLSDLGVRALKHASDGFYVVPFHGMKRRECTCGSAGCKNPGKHPILKDWPSRASVDVDEIAGWWLDHPDANIAVVAGPSGLLVVDVDDRHGGWDSLDEMLEATEYEAWETVTSLTGGNGAHFLFKNTLPIGARKHIAFKPGIDILVGNAAFLAPGSAHASGNTYEWAAGQSPSQVPVAEPPPWLSHQILGGKESVSSTPALATDGRVHEGARNSRLYGLASNFARSGIKGTALLAIVRNCNDSLCDPPLDSSEVANLVASAESRALKRPATDRLKLLSKSDLMRLRQPEFLIDGVLYENSLGMMWGDSNVGKTFMALHLAGCVASGLDFFGHPTRQGDVVYVIAEGQGSFGARLRAWEKLNKQKVDGRMSFVTTAIQLHDESVGDRFIEMVRAADSPPALVVIDTLARCFVDKDENSSRDAGLLVAGCQRLQEELGCAVLLLHHCGKGDKATYRGSSAFEGALDTIMSVERVPKSETDVVLRCRKQREAEYFGDIRAERVTVSTSAAMRRSEGPTRFGDTACDDGLIVDEVVRIYEETGKPAAFSDLLDATGLSKSTFVRRLKQLLADDVLEKHPKGYFPFGRSSGLNCSAA